MKVTKELKEYIRDKLEERLKELKEKRAQEYNRKYEKELSRMKKLLDEYEKIKKRLEKASKDTKEIYFSEMDRKFVPSFLHTHQSISRLVREYAITLQYAESSRTIQDIVAKIKKLTIDEILDD